MTIAEKLTKIAENEQKVYEAGQKSMIDESKIIEKTVSGSAILLDDVSEVPHEISVQLSSDTVTDFSNVNVRVSSKNLIKYPYTDTTLTTNGITFTDNGDTSITISGKATADAIFKLFTLDVGTSNMWNEAVNNNEYFVSGCKHFFYNGSNKIHSIGVPSGTDYSTNPITVKPQLYRGNSITDAVTIYKPNADGTLTIKSASPNMYITAETDIVYITATYNKSWGMQTEYDRFWDEYQKNGNLRVYETTFAGSGWNDTTFTPKYPIKPSHAYLMFYNSHITNCYDILKQIDFSACVNFQGFILQSKIKHLGVINTTNVTGLAEAFRSDSIKTIDKVILKNDGSQSFFDNSFRSPNLENITFEGTIGNNILFNYCTRLTTASLLSILTALSKDSTIATGKTITLSTVHRSKIEADTECMAQLNAAIAAGWTVAYV